MVRWKHGGTWRAIALVAVAGGAAGAGCVATEPVRAAEPPILCEASYTNFAWTPVLIFTGITRDGQVLHFDSRENTELRGFSLLNLALPDRPRGTDIAHRYVISSPTGAVVPRAVLDRITELAAQARDGSVTREQRGADMGQRSLVCFVPLGDGSPRFETVLIRSDGDWEERNTHPAAAELAELLTPLLDPGSGAP